ncbi:MAG: glycosyltransferase family 39 protein [Phycisphaerae bacterium]|nr:glycosyltransferase family 39 protein [Phycisphaerae bacterium]
MRISLIFAVLAALCLRVYMVVYHTHEGGFSKTSYFAPTYLLAAGYGYQHIQGPNWEYDDDFANKLEARSLALAKEGRQLDRDHGLDVDPNDLRPLFYRAPGYAAYLYVLYRVFGEPLGDHAVMVQVVLSSFYPLLVYVIVMRLFASPGAAVASAWLTAIHPSLAVLAAGKLPDCLSVGILLLAVVCWIGAVKGPSYGWSLMTGLLLGIDCYFRGNAMLLWLALGLVFLIVRRGWARPLLSTAIMAVGLYVALSPWAIRNYRLSGHWIWTSTAVGRSLGYFVGMYPNSLGLKDDDAFIMQYAVDHGFECDSTPEADAFFRDSIKRYYRQNPGRLIRATLGNLPWALAPPYQTGLVSLAADRFPNTFSHYREVEGLSPLRVLIRHPLHVLRNYGERILVMLVSAAGNLSLLWLVLRRWPRRSEALMLAALPLYFIAVHSVGGFMHGMPRYLAPLIPFQMMGLALVGGQISGWLRRRSAAA